MNELYLQLENGLNELSKLLDQEKACLIALRYEDLLGVVNRKRATQAALEADLARLRIFLDTVGDASDTVSNDRLRQLAERVRDQGRYNQRLARASIQVVDSVRSLLSKCTVGPKGYDRGGSTIRPQMPSVLSQSA